MKKVELLSPAGSIQSAIAAIQNGCDAIYMAGSRFGARAYATNFDEVKMKEAIAYAHGYGVKIYITLNTLIHDDELEDCFSYIQFLYESKVDAIIVQDMGILDYIRRTYPDFEVHASTQMHVYNESSLLLLKSLGVKRAVLAREVTIEEIRQLSKIDIELEVFVHGALCVAYSGQCLFSAMIGNRSGNRGECAQGCRMPYTLIDDNNKIYNEGYLLSLKDLNTIDKIEDIVHSNVSSLKLEGRMKKSEYVASITQMYRNALNHIDNNKKYIVSNQTMKQNKILFNRGYTHGFMYQDTGNKLYNPIRPNHMGIEVGKVIKANKDKITIQLCEDLNQHDGIRFIMKEDIGCKVNRMYQNDLLVNKASKGSIIQLDNTFYVEVGCKVLKTSDYYLEKQIQKEIEEELRRVSITMHFEAHANETMKLYVFDDAHQVEVKGNIVEEAKKLASSEELVYKQLSKTKDTIFEVTQFTCEMDNHLFIVNKALNEMRRNALQQLLLLRKQACEREVIPYTIQEQSYKYDIETLLCCVLNEEQLLTCLELDMKAIYVMDNDLYSAYKHTARVHLRSSKVHKESYEEVSMIQDIGGLYECKDKICDASIHVYNAYSALFLKKLGVKAATLSLELNDMYIKQLMDHYTKLSDDAFPMIKVIYGRVEVMVSKHNPVVVSDADINKQYYLKDKFNNAYPLMSDNEKNMHLYDFNIKDEIHKIEEYKGWGIHHFRLDFTTETKEEVKRTISNAKKTLLGSCKKP